MIALTAKVFPGVLLEEGCIVGEYVVIGVQPKNIENVVDLKTVIKNGAIIRSHTVIYLGNTIGENFQTGHGVMIREFNKIGDNVSIGTHSVIEHHVGIGNNVRIHSNVFIPEYSILENDSWVGPNVVFTNALYPLGNNVKQQLKGPEIKAGAKIGANATLLPNIVIGENSLIGAGSVVTHNVPDCKVVVGNPAKIIGDITDIPAYK